MTDKDLAATNALIAGYEQKAAEDLAAEKRRVSAKRQDLAVKTRAAARRKKGLSSAKSKVYVVVVVK
jgi:hypothetical protein